MELGTRLRYGMLAMLELVRRGGAVPVRAADIAKAGGLSKGYLEGLLAALRRAGLVRAVRGPGGGWVLARAASRVRPIDVYAALEGPTSLVACVENETLCPRKAKRCRARRLWVSMTRAIEKTLRAETLAALAGPRRVQSSRVSGRAARKPTRSRQRAAPKAPKESRKKRPDTKAKARKPADKKRAGAVRNRQIVEVIKGARPGVRRGDTALRSSSLRSTRAATDTPKPLRRRRATPARAGRRRTPLRRSA